MSFSFLSSTSFTMGALPILCASENLSVNTWNTSLTLHADALTTYLDESPSSRVAEGLRGVVHAHATSISAGIEGSFFVNQILERAAGSLRRSSEQDLTDMENADVFMMASALLFIGKLAIHRKQVSAPALDMFHISANIALELTGPSDRSLTGVELFAVDCALSRVQAHLIEGLTPSQLSYPQRMAIADVSLRAGMARGSQYWEKKGYALPYAEEVLRSFYPGIEIATIREAPLYIIPSTYFYVAYQVSRLAQVGLQQALALYLEGSTQQAREVLAETLDADGADEARPAIEAYEGILSRVGSSKGIGMEIVAAFLDVPPTEKVALMHAPRRRTLSLPKFLTLARGPERGAGAPH